MPAKAMLLGRESINALQPRKEAVSDHPLQEFARVAGKRNRPVVAHRRGILIGYSNWNHVCMQPNRRERALHPDPVEQGKKESRSKRMKMTNHYVRNTVRAKRTVPATTESSLVLNLGEEMVVRVGGTTRIRRKIWCAGSPPNGSKVRSVT